ncbi:GNAT family N-acetyltransferase [Paenibacillus sp. MER 180]|uniref:GNAT family N-acetyltransferase n=1 Tax=Paenibacillus sp. MER 180 TaxID=2939570 RepID=UPI00203E1330|nr:GNAT family N-acetyltransferase [Paenibacillus sp. MER 180]MCM3293024.1 GNAT family N-acetyltransferase [Paenibacillus sp. MER 180]
MITIRSITENDLLALSQLYRELMGQQTNQAKLEQVYRTIQHNEQYIILGAFDEEQLVGSLMGIICHDLVGDCKPFMVIENVIVSPVVRRQGVGKKLMQEIENMARQRDCYYIIFVSGEQRKEAHQFYERLGFKDEKVEGYRKHLT